MAPWRLATIAGIAERNVRFGELLRQREERSAGEAEADQPPAKDPWQLALEALRDDQQHLVADLFHEELRTAPARSEAEVVPLTEEQSQAALLAWVRKAAALSEKQVAAEMKKLAAREAKRAEEFRAKWDKPPKPPPPPAEPPPVAPAALDETIALADWQPRRWPDLRDEAHDRGWYPLERRPGQ